MAWPHCSPLLPAPTQVRTGPLTILQLLSDGGARPEGHKGQSDPGLCRWREVGERREALPAGHRVGERCVLQPPEAPLPTPSHGSLSADTPWCSWPVLSCAMNSCCKGVLLTTVLSGECFAVKPFCSTEKRIPPIPARVLEAKFFEQASPYPLPHVDRAASCLGLEAPFQPPGP